MFSLIAEKFENKRKKRKRNNARESDFQKITKPLKLNEF